MRRFTCKPDISLNLRGMYLVFEEGEPRTEPGEAIAIELPDSVRGNVMLVTRAAFGRREIDPRRPATEERYYIHLKEEK